MLGLAAATAARADNAFAAADAHAMAAVANGEVPSAAYAISRGGRVLHARAVGQADRERRIPATLRTAYPLASLTKPITATALLTLRQRGRLTLEQPLSTVLPLLAPAASTPDPLREVTLERLLHHTAGLGTYARIYFGPQRTDAATRSLASQRPYLVPVQPPGRLAEYSNLGYGLIGEVIVELGGMPLASYVRQSVFRPLGMRDAFIADAGTHGGAVGYDTRLERLPPLWNDTPGAGNAYASVEDLLRFGAFHLDPTRSRAMARKLPADVVVAMRRPDPDGAQHVMYGSAWYGQGWYVRGSTEAPTMFWHEGGMPGASALLALYPETGLVVTVLVNRGDAQAFVQSLAERLLRAAWADAPPLKLDPVSDFAPLQGGTSFNGSWAGTLRVDGTARTITLEIDAHGNGRIEYEALPGEAPTSRTFAALVRASSLVSAIAGPWQSADAPDGASALLLKLTQVGDDHLQGALVAYEGPKRLQFLLPFALDLRRTGPP